MFANPPHCEERDRLDRKWRNALNRLTKVTLALKIDPANEALMREKDIAEKIGNEAGQAYLDHIQGHLCSK